MAKTLEEAVANQLRVHAAGDAGEHVPQWRAASLHPDYEFKSAIHHGMGKYSVHRETGEVHECKMEWHAEGKVLICPVCYLDGT